MAGFRKTILHCGFIIINLLLLTPRVVGTTVSQISESLSCHLNTLPLLGSEPTEYEVACSWINSQPGEAHFYSTSDEKIDVDIRIPGRIISRIDSLNIPRMVCRFMLDNDPPTPINVSCIRNNVPGLVRIDPFVSEVTLGSNATFNCTSSNQINIDDISWDASINGSVPFDRQGRVVKNDNTLTILNVEDGDKFMVVECKVHFSEDSVMSSYASLQINEDTTPLCSEKLETTSDRSTIEVTTLVPLDDTSSIFEDSTISSDASLRSTEFTTSPSQRPPEGTNSNITTKLGITTQRSTTEKQTSKQLHYTGGISDSNVVSSHGLLRSTEVTTPSSRTPPGKIPLNQTTEIGTTTGQSTTNAANYVLPIMPITLIMILFTIFVVLIVAIIFLVRRRKRRSLRHNYSSGLEDTSDALELKKIPHIRHDGSSQLYALSFKDKMLRRHRSVGTVVEDGLDETNIDGSLSLSCGMLNLQPESTDMRDDHTYAEPYAPTESGDKLKNISTRLCNFMPFLDASEFETISDEVRSVQITKTASPNDTGDEFIGTCPSDIPCSFNPSLPEKKNKAASLNRAMSSRPGPPKPQRGKCQSMGSHTCSSISDYKNMQIQRK